MLGVYAFMPKVIDTLVAVKQPYKAMVYNMVDILSIGLHVCLLRMTAK